MLVLLVEQIFWPPSMVYISVITYKHYTISSSSHMFLTPYCLRIFMIRDHEVIVTTMHWAVGPWALIYNYKYQTIRPFSLFENLACPLLIPAPYPLLDSGSRILKQSAGKKVRLYAPVLYWDCECIQNQQSQQSKENKCSKIDAKITPFAFTTFSPSIPYWWIGL